MCAFDTIMSSIQCVLSHVVVDRVKRASDTGTGKGLPSRGGEGENGQARTEAIFSHDDCHAPATRHKPPVKPNGGSPAPYSL